MQRTTPTLMLAASAAIALALTGCASQSSPGSDEDTAADPIRYAVEEPDSLVPGNHFGSYAILFSLFSPLTSLDSNGEISYLAAESVESDDAITWTITLREGWTFHNGEPVTAQDYVDTWNHAAYGPNGWVNGPQLAGVVGYADLNPGEGEPAAEELSGLTVIDERTFTVELGAADRQFPLQLTAGQTGLYPLPSEALEDVAAWEQNPVGNGPFQLTGTWSPNAPIETVAYEGYAGPAPSIDAVTFVPYLDTATAYTDTLAGQVDIVAIGGYQAGQARTDFGDHVYELDAPGVDFLGFNLDDPRFSDVRVRQAISMAIDREAINNAVFGGSQVPATSLTAPSMPGDPAGICGRYCEFDPEGAKALLEEAGGFEGGMEIHFIANWGQEDLFEAIANQIRQNLGISSVVAAPASDFAAFVDRVSGGDVNGPFRARWGALYPSQQNTLMAVYTASGEGNFGAGGYSDAEVDDLLRAANAADTYEESYEGYRLAQERILEDFPTVPLFGNRYLYVTSDRIAELYTVSGGVDLNRVVLAD
ncbi:ABC transporter substrate-binding protein [Microbacterium sp. NIBRBAC000506063]|uniref:peptide ABC transporter substrate-binding protein n=1 Tax=Microbacterium sp. NIBRBAC000506063 TaxID=2734618 RepID=UPI001BB7063D|nr:ABC transporter substrate-binding protein [Microbacterium sp. NIBRBAC000506063]QTV80297.1 ABC transporter substrate-binding protein [Microbacterium sp. NIBRBAC000506063]